MSGNQLIANGLPRDVKEEEIQALFTDAGHPIGSMELHPDKGIAYLYMEGSGEAARQAMNGKLLKGRPMRVQSGSARS
ncbi:RNA recognition motif domain-containing protein [Streptomyces sp. NPDC059979]|uniref:RNA recognition motif domain-containing protein n=1 Tax=Streptomyces sp. NPDC059979 TaxID=3347021 RepID=UPI0036896288